MREVSRLNIVRNQFSKPLHTGAIAFKGIAPIWRQQVITRARLNRLQLFIRSRIGSYPARCVGILSSTMLRCALSHSKIIMGGKIISISASHARLLCSRLGRLRGWETRLTTLFAHFHWNGTRLKWVVGCWVKKKNQNKQLLEWWILIQVSGLGEMKCLIGISLYLFNQLGTILRTPLNVSGLTLETL